MSQTEKSTNSMRVMIVDDHLVTRVGIAALINAQSDMTVVAEAANGHKALEHCARLRPDVILMDLEMPEMDGIAAIRAILRQHREARILVVSEFEGDGDIERALRAGARGYLFKNVQPEELMKAIRAVYKGEEYLSYSALKALKDSRQYEALSPRELDVLALIRDGQSNKEIAQALHISEFTIKNHVRNILAKLNVPDRTAAVTLAIDRGLIRKCEN